MIENEEETVNMSMLFVLHVCEYNEFKNINIGMGMIQ